MEHNNKRLDDLFSQAKNEPSKVSYQETATEFLNASSNIVNVAKGGRFSSFFNIKNVLISAVIGLISIGAALFFNSTEDNSEEKASIKQRVETILTDSTIITQERDRAVAEHISKVNTLSPKLIKTDTNKRRPLKPKKKLMKWFQEKQDVSANNIETVETYGFPNLNEKEREANSKKKYEMLRELARYKRVRNIINEKKYPIVYWNKITKIGKSISVDPTGAFHIQKTEVSNLEYRTFLFDLLIQGRKQEFLIAKPDQTRWVKDYTWAFNEPMQQNYFSHPAYNDYPVVCISRQGAEMYCEWLTSERNKLDPKKYEKLTNDVRLPTAIEWEQAAKGRIENAIYPWKEDDLQNAEGTYLANFQPIKGNFIVDGGFHTVKVDSYNPNGIGLYCMAGNVAEMVYDENNKPGTKGGSWTSLNHELRITDGNDRFKGLTKPSCDVGFRPVISYLKENPISNEENSIETVDTYRFPNLNEEEWKAHDKQIKKMFGKAHKKEKGEIVGKKKNETWYQPDPEGFLFIPMGSYDRNGKTQNVQAFYMKETEVTNLEYRTFLFDLLRQNKKSTFLKAKPDQTRWVKDYFPNSGLEVMQDNYFSHEDYNDYPVVGIAREGAISYCVWFAEQLNRDEKKLANDMRLPMSYEWEWAAKGGINEKPYPWGGPFLTNNTGEYLANFKPKRPEGIGKEGESEFCYICDGALHTAKTKSYPANAFGLYDMAGNVAEMVLDDNLELKTKGGSWSSVWQELQIVNGNDRFKGLTKPSVDVGFRPVMTYLGRSGFEENYAPVIPGAVKIDRKLYADKFEITNADWIEYEVWVGNKYGMDSEEYKLAQPDSTVWKVKSYYKDYVKFYKNHPYYKNYPLVGITYEQAIAFCVWRTDRVKEVFEIQKKTDKKNIYPTNFEYRLPSKSEWERLASAGYDNETQHKLEGKHEGKPRINVKRGRDEIMNSSYLQNFVRVTAPAESFWPNKYGVFNIIGNVAEMISEKGIAKGGSWIHEEQEVINIEKDYPYEKQNHWVGFRCVLEIKD